MSNAKTTKRTATKPVKLAATKPVISLQEARELVAAADRAELAAAKAKPAAKPVKHSRATKAALQRSVDANAKAAQAKPARVKPVVVRRFTSVVGRTDAKPAPAKPVAKAKPAKAAKPASVAQRLDAASAKPASRALQQLIGVVSGKPVPKRADQVAQARAAKPAAKAKPVSSAAYFEAVAQDFAKLAPKPAARVVKPAKAKPATRSQAAQLALPAQPVALLPHANGTGLCANCAALLARGHALVAEYDAKLASLGLRVPSRVELTQAAPVAVRTAKAARAARPSKPAAKLTADDAQFVAFLDERLIPDLLQMGHRGLAGELRMGLRSVPRLDRLDSFNASGAWKVVKRSNDFVTRIEQQLAPDLDASMPETAADLRRLASIVESKLVALGKRDGSVS